MKIPRTPEEVRGDFLRSIISVFENFVSRHIILVGIDNCAFKFVTCSYAYGVNDIVTYTVGIRAVGHCNEQVVGLDKFDFVYCEAAVNCYGCNSYELSVCECLSEYYFGDVHVVVVLSVSVGSNVDVRYERLTFSVNLVSGKYSAFNKIACSIVDWVNDIVVVPGFVLAARHSYKEVVGFDYLDFVDCNEAVNCQRSDCFQGSVREGPSEFDV